MDSNSTTKHMGYTPITSLLQILSLYRDGKIEPPFTTEKLRALKMPQWNLSSLLNTLQDFNLYKDGHPTELFIRLAQAYQTNPPEYQDILRTLLNHVYAKVIANIANAQIDIATATASEIEKAFSDYEPENQRRRMAYLYLGLCREASLTSDVEKVPHRSNGKFAPKVKQTVTEANGVRKLREPVEVKPMEPPQVKTSGVMHTPPKFSVITKQVDALQCLLQMPTGTEWTEEQNEWWQENFRNNVQSLLRLVTEKRQEA